jgi:adenylate cyclase
MRACYRNRDGDGALLAIGRGRKSVDGHALQYLYDLYEARITGYQKNPPPEDWNGAFALLTK